MNKSLSLAAASLVLALSTGAAMASSPELDYENALAATTSRPVVDRAEVIADLHLWQRAGLTAVPEPDVISPNYQKKLAVYQQLRNSPAFANEVARVREQQQTIHTAAAKSGRAKQP